MHNITDEQILCTTHYSTTHVLYRLTSIIQSYDESLILKLISDCFWELLTAAYIMTYDINPKCNRSSTAGNIIADNLLLPVI